MTQSGKSKLQTDLDDGQRGKYGVGVSLRELGNSSIRLVLDDLERAQADQRTWRMWSFFTFIDLDQERFLSCELSEEDFAGIGRALVARLSALHTTNK